MLRESVSTVGQLLVGDERTTGDSIRSQNGRTICSIHLSFIILIFTVMAALAMSIIVITYLGPVCLDKMLGDGVEVCLLQ